MTIEHPGDPSEDLITNEQPNQKEHFEAKVIQSNPHIRKLWTTEEFPSLAALEWLSSQWSKALPCSKVSIFQNYLVKYGYDVSPSEAWTLRYLQLQSFDHIPNLHAVFQFGPFSRGYAGPYDTYIFMDHIEGKALEESWMVISEQQKMRICDQIRHILAQLAAVPSPDSSLDRIGAITHTSDQLNRPIWSLDGDFRISWGSFGYFSYRPYQSNAAFYEEVQDQIKTYQNITIRQPETAKVAMTHGDLCPRHIIFDKSSRIYIIDWGNSGFFPEYIERVEANRANLIGFESFFDMIFSPGT